MKKCTLDFLQLDFFSDPDKLKHLEGLGLDRKDEIYSFVREKVEYHLPAISSSLNEILKVEKSNRFWRILFGHWFSLFTQLCYFRYQVLSEILNSGVVSRNPSKLFDQYLTHLSLRSTAIFPDAYISKIWNKCMSHFSVQLLAPNNISQNDFEISFLEADLPSFPTIFKKVSVNSGDLRSLIMAGKRFLNSSRVVIYKSYFEKKTNIFINLRLGILPKVLRVPSALDSEPDPSLRYHLYKFWSTFCADEFDRFLVACTAMVFPRSFLEAFLSNQALLIPTLCKEGDIVFTSNGFDGDDLFQLFSALSVENGAKYVVGQHGNSYCSSRHFFSQNELIKTTDYFLSWGSRGIDEKSIPTFNFKYSSKKLSSKKRGPILILLHRAPSPMFMWDRYREDQVYIQRIRDILSKLDHGEFSDVIVRFHKKYEYFGGDKDHLILDFPKFIWDDGNQPLKDILKNCSLVIHTYHSTGILETLNQDIPTLVFWPCGWELTDKSEQDYMELEAVGILHHDVDSLIQEINFINEEAEMWWRESARTKIVRSFCAKYSRHSRHPSRDIVQVFKKILHENGA